MQQFSKLTSSTFPAPSFALEHTILFPLVNGSLLNWAMLLKSTLLEYPFSVVGSQLLLSSQGTLSTSASLFKSTPTTMFKSSDASPLKDKIVWAIAELSSHMPNLFPPYLSQISKTFETGAVVSSITAETITSITGIKASVEIISIKLFFIIMHNQPPLI